MYVTNSLKLIFVHTGSYDILKSGGENYTITPYQVGVLISNNLLFNEKSQEARAREGNVYTMTSSASSDLALTPVQQDDFPPL